MGIKSKLKKGLAVLLATAVLGCSSPKLSDCVFDKQYYPRVQKKVKIPKTQTCEFAYDNLRNSETGAKNIVSFNNLQQAVVNKIIKQKSPITRAGLYYFFMLPISDWLMVYQHEYFGHGFTHRDIWDGEEATIKMTPPLPWPFAGGHTSFDGDKMFYDLDKESQEIVDKGIDERLSSAGGIEANRILNKYLRTKMFNSAYTVSDAALYFNSKLCLNWYVSQTSDDRMIKRKLIGMTNMDYYLTHMDEEAHDIINYIETFNFPRLKEYHKVMKKSDFVKAGFYHLADPFFVKSLIDQVDYIGKGKYVQEPLKIPFACSASLTPAGIEYVADFYSDNKEVQLRAGKNSSGIAVRLSHLMNSRLADSIAVTADLFNQKISYSDIEPIEEFDEGFGKYLIVGWKEIPRTMNCTGYGLKLDATKKIGDGIALKFGIMMKDRGYIGGQSFKKGAQASVGLEAKF